MERLQKIIARSGIASRRFAEGMIKSGRVSVNDRIVTMPGTKANSTKDKIRVDGKLISTDASFVYVMVNKPKGYITALRDPQERPIVTDLLDGVQERIFPVGRLDYDSEGLLLMTNDGDFAYRIQHPKFGVSKTYRVKIRGEITGQVIATINRGINLHDGYFKPLHTVFEKMNRKSCWLRITVTEGRNRIIRRFFDSINLPVVRLIRIAVGELELGDLREGKHRYLNRREVKKLLNAQNR